MRAAGEEDRTAQAGRVMGGQPQPESGTDTTRFAARQDNQRFTLRRRRRDTPPARTCTAGHPVGYPSSTAGFLARGSLFSVRLPGAIPVAYGRETRRIQLRGQLRPDSVPWSLPDSLFPRLGAGTVDHRTVRRPAPVAAFHGRRRVYPVRHLSVCTATACVTESSRRCHRRFKPCCFPAPHEQHARHGPAGSPPGNGCRS